MAKFTSIASAPAASIAQPVRSENLTIDLQCDQTVRAYNQRRASNMGCIIVQS